jgi:hypothetical protein
MLDIVVFASNGPSRTWLIRVPLASVSNGKGTSSRVNGFYNRLIYHLPGPPPPEPPPELEEPQDSVQFHHIYCGCILLREKAQ